MSFPFFFPSAEKNDERQKKKRTSRLRISQVPKLSDSIIYAFCMHPCMRVLGCRKKWGPSRGKRRRGCEGAGMSVSVSVSVSESESESISVNLMNK